MNLRQSLLAGLLIVACGRELPTSTPLGGILDDGVAEGYTPDRRPRSDAGEAAQVAESSEPPRDERDAGPADAGLAKQEDAGADAATDAGPADATARWAGEYVGSDLTVKRLAGAPEIREPDPKARTRVEDKGGSSIAIIIVNSANGEALCTLKAATKGTSATIEPGQDCFSGEAADVTVERGSAELKGERLVFDFVASIALVIADDTVEGRLEYHFDGARQ